MKTLPSLLAATFLSAAALAAGPPRDQDDTASQRAAAQFQALDRDGDRQISRGEATRERGLSDRFASLDADGDDALTRDEYMAQAAPESSP